MKSFIVFALCIATALAASVGDYSKAEILKSEFDNIGVDGYNFMYAKYAASSFKESYRESNFFFTRFETSDGTKRQESAVLKNAGSENEAINVRGSYSWVAADGQTYTVNFVADENGFQPEGAHLPRA